MGAEDPRAHAFFDEREPMSEHQASAVQEGAQLARRLGFFDATMIVMGGIIGSGIFINPYVVARQVHTPLLILGAWAAGGLIALAGAFIYAELAALRPQVGGQYAYIREAFHPVVAFSYGWTLLLVVQSGGMAAVATTFAPRSCPSWPILATMIRGLRPRRSVTKRVPSSASFQRPSRRALP